MKFPPTGFLLLSALLIPVLPGHIDAQNISTDIPAPEGTNAPSGKVLAPKFLKGQTYRFVSVSGIRMDIPGRGRREVKVEQQARLEASDRAAGKPGVAIRALTEKLFVSIKSGQKTVSYDSFKAEDKETTLGKHFQSAVNRWVILQLDPKMRIVDSREGGRVGAATPLPGMPQFGPDELKQLVGSIPQGFAPDPVKPGDEWVLKGEKEVSQAGKLDFDITYRHLGPFDYEGYPCIQIEFSGTMSGGAGTGNFDGTTVVGKMYFDPEIKMIRYSEQTVSMTLELPAPGQPGMKMQVPMGQKVASRLLHIVPTKVKEEE